MGCDNPKDCGECAGCLADSADHEAKLDRVQGVIESEIEDNMDAIPNDIQYAAGAIVNELVRNGWLALEKDLMTWYRVKVYQADDSDIERLVCDDYVESDCVGNAMLVVAQQRPDEGLFAAMRSFLGESPFVNSHRTDSVAQPHTNQGEI